MSSLTLVCVLVILVAYTWSSLSGYESDLINTRREQFLQLHINAACVAVCIWRGPYGITNLYTTKDNISFISFFYNMLYWHLFILKNTSSNNIFYNQRHIICKMSRNVIIRLHRLRKRLTEARVCGKIF